MLVQKRGPSATMSAVELFVDNDHSHDVHSSGDQVKSSLHEKNDIMDREIRTNIHMD